MGGTNTTNIAFIGFGEVGQTFARGFLKHEGVRVSAYDILIGTSAGERLGARASSLGVVWCARPEQAASHADFVISAVTASQAEAVAETARDWLKPGQIFVDVNSAAPSTKQRAAKHVEAAGADYIEAAVMAPVLKPGLQVPILSGGPRAAEVSTRLNALGMNLTPVSDTHGIASAMKLCRSIIIKGLEALMVDCAEASEQWGVKDPVFASLHATFPSIDFHALAADMRERVATHGVRRSAEMAEAGEMLAALGMNPDLALAVSAAHLRGAKPKWEG
ncbi:NAD(P)-dependent oxidoreductase [Rhizobiales bacterium TNE-4]|nr:NAD(P)-dependent oxidoreductase [Rhizobiales bacterium TNE-4]MBV1826993.1 prephenate dehydrogenase/arogenate dehydrogenase family protein [Rhizobiales bacterium TNE-4]